MVKIPFRTSPEDRLENLTNKFKDLRSLDNPSNSIVQAYNRQIFNNLLDQDSLDNVDEEALIKSTLTQVILGELSAAFAGLSYEELKNDKLFSDFKDSLSKIDSDYDPINDPEYYFQNTYLNKLIQDSDSNDIPLWSHTNFNKGNDIHEGQAVKFEDLYNSELLSSDEITDLFNAMLGLDATKALEITKDGKTKKVSTIDDLKEYFGLLADPTSQFENSQSIKNIQNFSSFKNLIDDLESNQAVNNILDKFFNIYLENINPQFANEIWSTISSHPLIKQNFNAIVDSVRDIQELGEYQLADVLSSKDNLRINSNLTDQDFKGIYADLQIAIQESYKADKSKEMSYLYEQFVQHEDVKIQGITYISNTTQTRIADLLTVKEEAPELGLSVGDLKKIQEEAKLYPQRLKGNFRSKLRRNKEEILKLQSSRVNLAKLRSYNAALDLELTNEELASGEANSKIKEEVFQKAISTDLDDLFLNYQAENTKSLRKTFNKATQWFGRKLAGVSAFAAIALPVGVKAGLKYTTAFAAGPLAAVGLGALFMKPATRRTLNWLRPQVKNDEKEYDKISLNFSEATRDMTGSNLDSVFNDDNDIENRFIKEQKSDLAKFQESISSKVDQEIESDSNISALRRSLQRSIKLNSDPENINKIAIQLKKAVSKKVVEFYTSEYKLVLASIEEKRHRYVGRLFAESALAFGSVFGLSYLGGLLFDKVDIVDNAEAAESNATENSNPKGGNDPLASKEDTESPSKTQNDPLKSKSDEISNDKTDNSSKGFLSNIYDKYFNPSTPIDKAVEKASTGVSSALDKSNPINSAVEKASSQVEEALNQAVSSTHFTGAKDFTFKVPTNTDLIGTTDKDPGLVQLFRSWTDNKLSVKDALEAAKMMDLKNINLIKDGEELKLPQKAVEFISERSKINPKDLLNKDITEQFIKYNKA